MPFVRVSMFEGRSIDQKRQIIEEITQTISSVCGISPESVDVLIEEMKRENWSHGGVLYSEMGSRRQSGGGQ
jgi:4-oxalocrotonate tautomerase